MLIRGGIPISDPARPAKRLQAEAAVRGSPPTSEGARRIELPAKGPPKGLSRDVASTLPEDAGWRIPRRSRQTGRL